MSKKDQNLANAFVPRDNPERRAQVADTTAAQSFQQEASAEKIALDLIDASPFQSRGKPDEAHLQELEESLRVHGQITPVVVRVKLGGRYELIAGHHRITALRAIGETAVKAEIKRVDDKTAARMLTADNAQHKALTDWELYKHIHMLRETKAAVTQLQLAEVLSFSRSQIAAIEHFRFLPASAMQLLDLHPGMMGATLAQQIKPYAQQHPELVTKALERLASKEIGQGGVITWIKKQLSKEVDEGPQTVILPNKARIVFNREEAKIVGRLDYLKLTQLIQQHYAELVSDKMSDSDIE